MRIFSILALCLFVFVGLHSQECIDITLESITDPGPYSFATMTEADGLRNGPDYFGATIYYPTDAEPPYASMAIVPGFLSVQSSVQAWGPFLASHGIVTMTIGTNQLTQFPDGRATALIDAIETLRQENDRVESPLFTAIDTSRFAVGGWSMGGGGAQLAASLDPDLKAVMALCPWLPAPQESDLDHDVPVLIFSGELDPTAPPVLHANIHYGLTPDTTDKLLFEVMDGNHSVANSPTGGDGDVGRIALSWLGAHLIEDQCYCPLLMAAPASASVFLTEFECEPLIAVCPADLNGDFVVDVSDFIAMNSVFNSTCAGCPADLSGDGVVDIQDFLILNSNFGNECPEVE